jgi:membrane fusion protein, multidrug efflux system
MHPHTGFLWFVVLMAAGCTPAPPLTEDVRPVRTLTVEPRTAAAVVELSGEVRPRVETRAGFQVSGRITKRQVQVGDRVKAGETLAVLDAQDFRLNAEAANAALASARVDRDQQRADYQRFADLQARGFISQADLDRRKAALDAAEARHQQAAAGARATGNQTEYTVLRAPHDAIVTAIDAEAGQVVTAGQSVVRLAAGRDKEVEVGIPEQQLALLGNAAEIVVRLWAGGAPLRGKLREVAPIADPATRTFNARIALADAPDSVAFGMTASVAFSSPAAAPIIALPLQALLVEGGLTQVWVYDSATGTVRRTRVVIGNVAGNDVVIAEGLRAGDIVVTAGAHQLKEQQKVKLMPGTTSVVAPAPATITVKPEAGQRS